MCVCQLVVGRCMEKADRGVHLELVVEDAREESLGSFGSCLGVLKVGTCVLFTLKLFKTQSWGKCYNYNTPRACTK